MLPAYGSGDPPGAAPIVVPTAEAPRNQAHEDRLLEELNTLLGAAVQTGFPTWHVDGAAEWLSDAIPGKIYVFPQGLVYRGAWMDFARGQDHDDPGNQVLNRWWPSLRSYAAGVRDAEKLGWKSVGDALEQACGISFCAATGERFLIHNDMGRLH